MGVRRSWRVGADCKSVVFDWVGSIPTTPTIGPKHTGYPCPWKLGIGNQVRTSVSKYRNSLARVPNCLLGSNGFDSHRYCEEGRQILVRCARLLSESIDTVVKVQFLCPPQNDKVAEWSRQWIANPSFMSSNLILVSLKTIAPLA